MLLVSALAGCGGSGAASSQATSDAGPANAATRSVTAISPAPATQTVQVRIEDGRISPPPGRVDVAKGIPLRLVVLSDVPDEVHVHGYDLETEVGPGKPGTLTFTADRTGLFEVETHESGKLLVQLAVR